MKKMFIAAALTLAVTSAFAAADPDGPTAECNGVKFATGPKGKGYSKLFANVQRVCGNKVNLCEVNTSGGLDNLSLLSEKNADVGIVQYDTWTAMKAGDDNIAALQLITPLNNNYLHVVTNAAGYKDVKAGKYFGKTETQVVINGFSDLRNGQKVAMVGSAQLLGRQLAKQLGYNIIPVDVKTDDQAFSMVKSGQVAAAFTVSGWPSGPVKALSTADGLTLVPFNAAIGDPYVVKTLNYKNIAVYNTNTLGTRNLLVTRPFTGARAQAVTALQSCIAANLDELKEGNFEPGWNEVNPNATVSGITQFKSSKK